MRGQRGRRGQSLTSAAQIRTKGAGRVGGAGEDESRRAITTCRERRKQRASRTFKRRSLAPSLPIPLGGAHVHVEARTHAPVGSLRTLIKSPPVFTHFHNIPCLSAYGENTQAGSAAESADRWRRAGVLRDLRGQRRWGGGGKTQRRTSKVGQPQLGRMSQQHQRCLLFFIIAPLIDASRVFSRSFHLRFEQITQKTAKMKTGIESPV